MEVSFVAILLSMVQAVGADESQLPEYGVDLVVGIVIGCLLRAGRFVCSRGQV